jgi:hypothetical protein
LGQGDRRCVFFRLECLSNHANQCAGAREILFQLWQTRFFDNRTCAIELLCQLLNRLANFRRDRQARKGWGKRNPQLREIEIWHAVNRHWVDIGIASIRPSDDLVKQCQILDRAGDWPNARHDPNATWRWEARDQAI